MSNRKKARAILQERKEFVCFQCLFNGGHRSSGMTHFRDLLEQELKVPVLDGVMSAVKIIESLVNLRLGISKIFSYAYPSKKYYKGIDELLHP